LLVILGVLLNPSFLSWNNLSNVLTRSAFIGIISVGGTFVIVTGQIDLSVGAMAAFIASLMIIVMNQFANAGWSLPLAIAVGMIIGLVVGLLSGLVNGLLATQGKIDSFIVTLGTMGIFRSLVTFVSNGGTLTLNSNIREGYRPVFYGSWFNITDPGLGSGPCCHDRFSDPGQNALRPLLSGCRLEREVAHYSAIRVNRIRVIAFVVQGFCVALATLLYVPRLGSASSSTGVLWELEAITAVVVGGTALRGGSGRVSGSIVGALILTLIGNILNLTNIISVYLNGAVQGIIILGAALLQRNSRTR
jgi:ribose transport system permease protein